MGNYQNKWLLDSDQSAKRDTYHIITISCVLALSLTPVTSAIDSPNVLY